VQQSHIMLVSVRDACCNTSKWSRSLRVRRDKGEAVVQARQQRQEGIAVHRGRRRAVEAAADRLQLVEKRELGAQRARELCQLVLFGHLSVR